jgi:hypothetical protein
MQYVLRHAASLWHPEARALQDRGNLDDRPGSTWIVGLGKSRYLWHWLVVRPRGWSAAGTGARVGAKRGQLSVWPTLDQLRWRAQSSKY